MSVQASTLGALTGRLAGGIGQTRALLARPWVQKVCFGIAIVIFAGGLFLSVRARPDLFAQVDLIKLCVIAGIVCPVLIALNAAIVGVSARLVGVSFSIYNCLRLTVLASALNHLPLPGGAIMRIAALKAEGANLASAAAVNFAAALMWMGFSAGLTGLWALAPAPVLGLVCLAGAAAALTAGWLLARRRNARPVDIAILAGLCLSVALVYWLALWAGFQALGVSASAAQAGVISGAGVIGSAASFLPAGLGAREAAGAGLAALISFDPYVAFATTALVQIAMIGCLIAASAAIMMFSPRTPQAHQQ